MKWVILGLALLAGCAAAHKVDVPECPHFQNCRSACESNGAIIKGMVESEYEVSCFCTKKPGDPS
jgi:hypothetical protein